jgi:hypothetical protein
MTHCTGPPSHPRGPAKEGGTTSIGFYPKGRYGLLGTPSSSVDGFDGGMSAVRVVGAPGAGRALSATPPRAVRYSCLGASIGSRRAARRAGKWPKMRPIASASTNVRTLIPGVKRNGWRLGPAGFPLDVGKHARPLARLLTEPGPVRPGMCGIEGEIARCRGQCLPHRPEKGVGVRSEKAPRGRDELALDQLDPLGERAGARGGRGGRGQRRHVGVARVLPNETMQADVGAPDIAADEPDERSRG